MTKKECKTHQPGKGPLSRARVVLNIIEAIADGVMVIAHDGQISLVNPALCRILALNEKDILSKGWGELFIEDGKNLSFGQVVVDVIQNNHLHYNSQVRYITPENEIKELIATTSLLREDDGSVIGVVAVFKDVTELVNLHKRERKLLEQSRCLFDESKESLDRIAQAVAHEVRNPVTAIGGLAKRLLKEKSPNSKDHDYLIRIIDSARSLEEIVEQVRKYAEIPSPVMHKVVLGSWLEKFLSTYQLKAIEQSVELDIYLKANMSVMIDSGLMTIALGHILENALESMPLGGKLTVLLNSHESFAIITVKDTGKGLVENDIPHLFDPFYTTKADSVGMSLAISRRIVAEHYGKVKASGELGQGAEFSIYLPCLKEG